MLKQLRLKLNYIKSALSNGHPNDFKKSQILFFCHDVDRGIELNGKAYAQILDTFREDFEARGFTCLTISHPFSSLTSIRGYGHPISINRKFLFGRLKNGFLKAIRVKTDSIGDLYDWILQKTSCKLIITIGSPPELARRARKRNVFHLELLHGIGYTFVPWGWEQWEIEKLPQGILALDQISYATFSSLSLKGIEIKTIPHPFLKRFTPRNLESIPNEWKMDSSIGAKYSKRILVSFTWGYAGDHGNYYQMANILNNGLFYDELAEVISLTKDEVFWHFRFHPYQLRQKKYNHLLKFMDKFVDNNPNTEWKMSSKLPLPSLLVNCDGHITMSSMSCYDAAAMGVKSLVLCPNMRENGIWEEYFSDLVEEGYVRKEPVSVEMLLDWVKTISKTEPRLSNLLDNDSWDSTMQWMLTKSGLDQ